MLLQNAQPGWETMQDTFTSCRGPNLISPVAPTNLFCVRVSSNSKSMRPEHAKSCALTAASRCQLLMPSFDLTSARLHHCIAFPEYGMAPESSYAPPVFNQRPHGLALTPYLLQDSSGSQPPLQPTQERPPPLAGGPRFLDPPSAWRRVGRIRRMLRS